MAIGVEVREAVEDEHGIPADKLTTVAQAARQVNDALDRPELRAAHVIGEVTNVNDWKGNIFFSLKDDRAKLRCVLFARHIDDYRPSEGDQVVVRGALDFHGEQGELSLKANRVVPVGEGDYYRKLRQLKQELREQGWFQGRQDVPQLPEKIGVIASEDSDAFSDVRDSIRERNPGVDIVLRPASVQGDDAVEELVDAIEQLDSHGVDSIVIARGGGDIEALQPFNTREVAAAIKQADTPVVTGIGHQEDETVAGLTADSRGITPTDASRKATADIEELRQQLDNLSDQLDQAHGRFQARRQQEREIARQERRETLYQAAIVAMAIIFLLWWAV